MQRLTDERHRRRRVPKHEPRVETQHAFAEPDEPAVTASVMPAGERVGGTVNFHDEAR